MGRNRYCAVSLYTGAGIGDVGFTAAGFDFLLMCEIEHNRSQLAKVNFPSTQVVVDDIRAASDEITGYVKRRVRELDEDLFLATCTAPCQGMSKGGQGKLLRRIREGKRPRLDPRNRLILPGLEIIRRVRPLFAVFENVCQMRNTATEDRDGFVRPILDIIRDSLGDDYRGEAYDVEFADYGVPQRRRRLITVYTRDENALTLYEKGIALVPEPTHSKNGRNGRKPWISVEEALRGFSPLDSKASATACSEDDPFHRVPILDAVKYDWIKNAPINESAFDNQCAHPRCGYQGNPTHGASRNREGINQAHKDTPLFCEKCGHLLPRPHVRNRDGTRRIMSGYTSAYKRMNPKLPASTLTRNMSYPCSDHKVHPFENRVLSFAEAFVVHTLSEYDYRWGPVTNKYGRTRGTANDSLIRDAIGESIPPKFTHLLGQHMIRLSRGGILHA